MFNINQGGPYESASSFGSISLICKPLILPNILSQASVSSPGAAFSSDG